MNHQITLLGGQISPVYWGIKEFNPDIVHILYSKESKKNLTVLKKLVSVKKLYTYQIDASDFLGILETIEDILAKSKGTYSLNLTGGTKIMALASLHPFSEKNNKYFYIDQKHTVFEMPEINKRELTATESIKNLLKLSGFNKFHFSTLKKTFNRKDKELAYHIFNKTKQRGFSSLLAKIIKSQSSENLLPIGKNITAGDYLFRKSHEIEIRRKDQIIKFPISKNTDPILCKGGWWELVVADSIVKDNGTFEHALNLEFISDNNSNILNEIDLLLSNGRVVHFIEMKSGNIKQEDVNKISTINKLYGSSLSHSFLISRYKPREDIIEKCNNLGIHLIVYSKSINARSNRFTFFNSIKNLNSIVIQKIERGIL